MFNQFNISDVAKYSQEFKKTLKDIEEKKSQETHEINVGAEAVKIKFNGKMECLNVQIDESMLKIDEKSTLQALIKAAINDAAKLIAPGDIESTMKDISAAFTKNFT